MKKYLVGIVAATLLFTGCSFEIEETEPETTYYGYNVKKLEKFDAYDKAPDSWYNESLNEYIKRLSEVNPNNPFVKGKWENENTFDDKIFYNIGNTEVYLNVDNYTKKVEVKVTGKAPEVNGDELNFTEDAFAYCKEAGNDYLKALGLTDEEISTLWEGITDSFQTSTVGDTEIYMSAINKPLYNNADRLTSVEFTITGKLGE